VQAPGLVTQRERRDAARADGDGRVRAYVLSNVRITRQALADVLSRNGVDVVAHTDCEGDVARTLDAARPDVALVDMAAGGTPKLVRTIALKPHAVPAIAFALPEDVVQIIDCAEAGAAGFASSDESLEDLVATIASVARGEAACSPRIATKLLRHLAASAKHGTRPLDHSLTARELEVAALLADGMTNKEIARGLSIEVATVKNHVHHILEKLGVHRRRDVRARARAEGLRLGG
jgi:two-component system nitrate/nitrite response regulator NarL